MRPYDRVFTLEHADQIQALSGDPIFLPAEYLKEVIIPGILISFIVIAMMYVVSATATASAFPELQLLQRRKIAYRITNFFVNLILGAAGWYYEYYSDVMPEKVGPEQSIRGFHELHPLSTFQIAYQLWAIPIGHFHVHESTSMLVRTRPHKRIAKRLVFIATDRNLKALSVS